MGKLKVQILEGGKAREVNTKTNPKMGVRHYNYESMLKTFDIVNKGELTEQGLEVYLSGIGGTEKIKYAPVGSIHKAQVLEGNNVIII